MTVFPIEYRNKFIDFLCKSIDWFLYERDLRKCRIHSQLAIVILKSSAPNFTKKWASGINEIFLQWLSIKPYSNSAVTAVSYWKALKLETQLLWAFNYLFLNESFTWCDRYYKFSFSHRLHCVKSVRIRSNFGRHFPTFGIQSKCGKMWTRITPNTDTFYAVLPTITKYELQVTSVFAVADLDCSNVKPEFYRKRTSITIKMNYFYKTLFMKIWVEIDLFVWINHSIKFPLHFDKNLKGIQYQHFRP